MEARDSAKETIVRIVETATASRSRLPMLDSIFERFEFVLTASFRQLVSTHIESSEPGVVSDRFGAIVDSLPAPCFVGIARADAWDSHILVVFDPPFAYAMIDMLMGGRVTTAGHPEGRAPTTIERKLAERLVRLVLDALSTAFSPITEVSFTFERLEANAQLAPITQPGDTAMRVTLPLTIEGGVPGTLTIVIPHAALDQVRDRLIGAFMSGKRDRDGEWARHFNNAFRDTTVSLSSVLPEIRLPLGKVMSWKPGDVLEIPIGLGEPITILCDGVPLLRGRIGRHGGRLAMQIESGPADRQEESEDAAGDA